MPNCLLLTGVCEGDCFQCAKGSSNDALPPHAGAQRSSLHIVVPVEPLAAHTHGVRNKERPIKLTAPPSIYRAASAAAINCLAASALGPSGASSRYFSKTGMALGTVSLLPKYEMPS